ncbi:MAG: hypothetical protein ACJZ1Z_03260 [Acidimicrobiales bacterium]
MFAVLSAILLDAKSTQLMRSEVGVALKLMRSIFASLEVGTSVICVVVVGVVVVTTGVTVVGVVVVVVGVVVVTTGVTVVGVVVVVVVVGVVVVTTGVTVVVVGSVVVVGAVSELPPQETTKAKQIRRQVFFISKDHFIFYTSQL